MSGFGRSLDPMDGVATLVGKAHPMLPPFIIEQIRKRESEERTRQEQPHLELPLHPMPPVSSPLPSSGEEETKRGIIIVEL
jgi:hypothetical protein